jgi:hypothetical protein
VIALWLIKAFCLKIYLTKSEKEIIDKSPWILAPISFIYAVSFILIVVTETVFSEYSIIIKAYYFGLISMGCFGGVIFYGRLRYERQHDNNLKEERRLILGFVGLIGLILFIIFFEEICTWIGYLWDYAAAFL